MMGDTMESEHNQICECPLLDELEMLSASSRDRHSSGDVETRAGHENRGRERLPQLL